MEAHCRRSVPRCVRTRAGCPPRALAPLAALTQPRAQSRVVMVGKILDRFLVCVYGNPDVSLGLLRRKVSRPTPPALGRCVPRPTRSSPRPAARCAVQVPRRTVQQARHWRLNRGLESAGGCRDSHRRRTGTAPIHAGPSRGSPTRPPDAPGAVEPCQPRAQCHSCFRPVPCARRLAAMAHAGDVWGRLETANEKGWSKSYDLADSVISIGRGQNALIRVAHPTVSNRHCILKRETKKQPNGVSKRAVMVEDMRCAVAVAWRQRCHVRAPAHSPATAAPTGPTSTSSGSASPRACGPATSSACRGSRASTVRACLGLWGPATEAARVAEERISFVFQEASSAPKTGSVDEYYVVGDSLGSCVARPRAVTHAAPSPVGARL